MPKGDKFKLKADPDDGTTPIANLLLEAVAMANLNGKEKGAILYLWRRTYGWELKPGERYKERDIPLKEWHEALCTREEHVSKILSGLVEKHILLRTFIGPGKGYIYRMNTNIAAWNSDTIDVKALQDLATLATKCNPCNKKQPLQDLATPPGGPEENDVQPDVGLPKVATLAESCKGGVAGFGNSPSLYKESIKESIKEISIEVGKHPKKPYGEATNVLLTDHEFEMLVVKFGEAGAKARIEELSVGIASKGYKYKSHYFTILSWDNKHQKEMGLKGGSHGTGDGDGGAGAGKVGPLEASVNKPFA